MEINKIEPKKKIERLMKQALVLRKHKKKIDKPLARLIMKKRQRAQVNKMINDR